MWVGCPSFMDFEIGVLQLLALAAVSGGFSVHRRGRRPLEQGVTAIGIAVCRAGP